MTDYAILLDLGRCIGCQACVASCKVGNELGEDFVVTVLMTMILDQVEGKQRRFYKINMELQNATTSEKVWIGDYEVQKGVTQAKHKW